MLRNNRGQSVIDESSDAIRDVVAFENVAAVTVNCLSLAVQNIVVFENVLADFSVTSLHLALSRLDCATNNSGFNRDVVLIIACPRHQGFRGTRVEHPHQVILQREIEAALTGVTLTTGAATKLVVDAPRFVTLSSQDVEPAKMANCRGFLFNLRHHPLEHSIPCALILLRLLVRVKPLGAHLRDSHELSVTTEHDVRSSTRHIGGDGHGTAATGLSNDDGFPRVILGVQHLVLNASLGKHPGELLALLHAGGSDQDRLAFLVSSNDVLDHLTVLSLFIAVNQVRLVFSDHRPVGRDRNHTKRVGAHELRGFGLCGSRHTGKLCVEAEVVLKCDGGEGLVLCLDFDALLSLDCLVDTFVVSTARED